MQDQLVDLSKMNYRRAFQHTLYFRCVPCDNDCPSCINATCFVHYDVMLRAGPLGVEAFCLTLTMLIGLIIATMRKVKVNIHKNQQHIPKVIFFSFFFVILK